MHDNLNKIIANSLIAPNLNQKSLELQKAISKIKESISTNQAAIDLANKIDLKNNNGFPINFQIIANIFKLIEEETRIYGTVTLSKKEDTKKIIYGKQIMNKGTIALINEGNTYLILELILRNILANNALIICTNGYMYGTNKALVEIISNTLEALNMSKNLIQLYHTEDYQELLSKQANIDLVIAAGDRIFQRNMIRDTTIPTITSGYNNFDLYIESVDNLDFINKLISFNPNINLYTKKSLNLTYENAMEVEDIDEAIGEINYNGNNYNATIFTNNEENAAKFIREVHSSLVTINTSPTIEQLCDIKQSDLITERTIIYPATFKVDKSI